MLTKEENELLTQVGPGTPTGELARRFWIPALPATELATPNGDPVRLRLLGENFVAWRDASGRLGLFDEYCMHRGASLALARCEGDGLRCLYHGWKYATDGTILETPNYKKSIVREKLRAPTYPIREAGGIIWVYLGPIAKQPPFPHYKFMDVPKDHQPTYYARVDCNWIQLLEGLIDPSHANILHQDTLGKRYSNVAQTKGDREDLRDQLAKIEVGFVSEDTAPECEVEDTLFGCHGVSIYDATTAEGDRANFARVHTWIMPYIVIPSEKNFVMSIPIDDEHSALFVLSGPPIAAKAERDAYVERVLAGPASQYVGSGYRWGPDERWGQDRASMRRGSYSGIAGTVPEDFAVILSMGPIYDRTRENLVPADQLCIRMRRRMLQAARDLRAGTEPFMLTPEATINLGGPNQLLRDPSRWREMVPGNVPFIPAGNGRRSTEAEPTHAEAKT